MVLQRWDPFRDFRRADRIINRGWRRPVLRAEAGYWSAPLDVVRGDESIVVQASLPGLSPDDIEVTIEDGVLTTKGETTSDSEESGEDYLLRERRAGKFHRSLRLPDYVDADNAKPGYENGVVTITFPKLEAKKAKRLEIKAA